LYIFRRNGKSSEQQVPIPKEDPDLSVLVMRFGFILRKDFGKGKAFPHPIGLLFEYTLPLEETQPQTCNTSNPLFLLSRANLYYKYRIPPTGRGLKTQIL
jgi:hypothetical protein